MIIEYILLGILAPIFLNLMHLLVGIYVVVQRGNILSLGFTGIGFLTKSIGLIFLTYVGITKINLDLTLNDKIPGIEIISTVKTTGPTGVEMEALTAASISALTVYDMVKSLDKSIIVKDLRLIFKDGGKSGLYESS